MYKPMDSQIIETLPLQLQTARLVGHRIGPGDFENLRLLHRNPVVMRTLSPTGEPWTEEETRTMIQRAAEVWETHGYGPWLFELDYTHTFIGYCGLRPEVFDGEDCAELRYAVRASQWGQGYASEMARAVLYPRYIANVEVPIVSTISAGDAPARKVLEKLGFTFDKNIERGGRAHELYRLER